MIYGFLSDTRITSLWLGTTGPARPEATARAVYLAVEAAAAAGGWAARGLVAAWRPLGRGLARFGARRRAICELRRLDDAVLRDIGVERDAIPAVVDGLLAPQDETPARPRRLGQRVVRRPAVAAPLPAQGPVCCAA